MGLTPNEPSCHTTRPSYRTLTRIVLRNAHVRIRTVTTALYSSMCCLSGDSCTGAFLGDASVSISVVRRMSLPPLLSGCAPTTPLPVQRALLRLSRSLSSQRPSAYLTSSTVAFVQLFRLIRFLSNFAQASPITSSCCVKYDTPAVLTYLASACPPPPRQR